MDLESRQKYVSATEERLIAEYEAHIARLYRLESEYGMNLDVFTDIYGLDVLDATESASKTVQSWVSLYEALQSDADLVIITEHYPMQPSIISTGRQREVKYATQFTVIDMDGEFTVAYTKADDNKASSIELLGVNALTLRTNSNSCGDQEWARGFMVLAKPHSVEGFRLARTDAGRYFTDGVMNSATALDVGVIGIKRGDDVTEKFRGIVHKDENVYFGLHRINQELERILA